MVKSHEELYDEYMEEMKEPEVKQKAKKEPPAGAVLPTFPPKKAKPPVKTAKAGGLMSASKRADGCATKGKTRGRMV
jgi:hypothetical protein